MFYERTAQVPDLLCEKRSPAVHLRCLQASCTVVNSFSHGWRMTDSFSDRPGMLSRRDVKKDFLDVGDSSSTVSTGDTVTGMCV